VFQKTYKGLAVAFGAPATWATAAVVLLGMAVAYQVYMVPLVYWDVSSYWMTLGFVFSFAVGWASYGKARRVPISVLGSLASIATLILCLWIYDQRFGEWFPLGSYQTVDSQGNPVSYLIVRAGIGALLYTGAVGIINLINLTSIYSSWSGGDGTLRRRIDSIQSIRGRDQTIIDDQNRDQRHGLRSVS
jgi:hypothetical protein